MHRPNPNGLLQQQLRKCTWFIQIQYVVLAVYLYWQSKYCIYLSQQSLTSKPLWISLRELKASGFHLLNKNLDNCKKHHIHKNEDGTVIHVETEQKLS